MAVTRRAIDRDAAIHEFLAGFVDVVDPVGEVTEIASLTIFLGVPVVGELDLGALVTGRCEKNQSKPAFFVVIPSEFNESELVAIEIERRVDIRYTNHRMQVLHHLAPSGWRPHNEC